LKLTISIGEDYIVWNGKMKIPAPNDNTTKYKDFWIQQMNNGDVSYGTGSFWIGNQRWEPLTAQYFQTYY
jgi:hypothetical protein